MIINDLLQTHIIILPQFAIIFHMHQTEIFIGLFIYNVNIAFNAVIGNRIISEQF